MSTMTSVPLGTLEDAVRIHGDIPRRFRDAQEEVRISGRDCKVAVEANSPHLRRLLKRDCRVKIMCVDYRSTAATLLPDIDKRFSANEPFIESMRPVHRLLWNLRVEFPITFEFRYLPSLPSQSFFIMDPNQSTGWLKVEIYSAQPWTTLESHPHLLIKQEHEPWWTFFLGQWENYWNLARPPEEEALAVPFPFAKGYVAGDQYGVCKDLNTHIRSAKRDVFVIDAYLDDETFDLYLDNVPKGRTIRVLTDFRAGPAKEKKVRAALAAFGGGRGSAFAAMRSPKFHDRVIFVDNDCWVIGQSLKEAAVGKPTYVVQMPREVASDMLATYNGIWGAASAV